MTPVSQVSTSSQVPRFVRFVLLSVAVLQVAFSIGCATGVVVSSGPTSLVVSNNSAVGCGIFVDGYLFRRIPAATTLLLWNLPSDPYDLGVECAGQPVRVSRIDPAAGVRAEIPGEETPVDRTAMLSVHNPSPFDLEVLVDGESVGKVFSGHTGFFSDVEAGVRQLLFREVHTSGEWTQPVELASRGVTRLELNPPGAHLSITNDSQERATVTVRGRSAVVVERGASVTLENLAPGRNTLKVAFPDSGREMIVAVNLNPGEIKGLPLTSQTGALGVENRTDEVATLRVNGVEVATVSPSESYLIRDMVPGPAVAKVKTASGVLFERSFSVLPDSSELWVVQLGGGELALHNLIGDKAFIVLDGNMIGGLDPGQRMRFPVAAGRHKIAAVNERTSYSHVVEVEVESGRRVEFPLGPQAGRLLVDNRTKVPLTMYRNGRPLSGVGAGQAIEYSGLPFGRTAVEAVDQSGRKVLSRVMEILPPSKGERAALVISDVTVKIRVVNRTGEPLRIDPELVSEQRLIQPDRELELEMKGEVGVVRFIGTSSNLRYARKIEGVAGQVVTVEFTPQVGGVVVENSSGQEVEFFIDGRKAGVVEDGGSTVDSRLSPGKHLLMAKVKGEVYDEISTYLTEGSWFVWRLMRKGAAISVFNKTEEDLRLVVDGKEVGVLKSGARTVLRNLPERELMMVATGLKTTHWQRFTVLPKGGETVNWTVNPVSGGVRLFGLGGLSGELHVKGQVVAKIPDGVPEPVSVSLQPGVHPVRVTLSDGSSWAFVETVSAGTYSAVHLKDAMPELEVRNQTSGVLVVKVDGAELGELGAGSSLMIRLSATQQHTVEARNQDGSRAWLLPSGRFPEGGRFGWTLTE